MAEHRAAVHRKEPFPHPFIEREVVEPWRIVELGELALDRAGGELLDAFVVQKRVLAVVEHLERDRGDLLLEQRADGLLHERCRARERIVTLIAELSLIPT